MRWGIVGLLLWIDKRVEGRPRGIIETGDVPYVTGGWLLDVANSLYVVENIRRIEWESHLMCNNAGHLTRWLVVAVTYINEGKRTAAVSLYFLFL